MLTAARRNRVATHLPTPKAAPPALPEVPVGARARGQLWSDTVFQAVLLMRSQLANPDAAVAMAAAEAILEMERTRMRHCKTLAGSEMVSEEQLRYEEEEERRDAARCTPRRPAVPPVAEAAEAGTRTDAQALAEHAREMVAALAGSEHPVDLRRATVYVAHQLKTWGLAPSAVPAGGYGDLVRARFDGDDDEPV